ncbi:MAG: hypothetical protein HQK51_10640 [Oligoflexia bacterium]|nr:hypothetical protein [Oligoflexia bacterium]
MQVKLFMRLFRRFLFLFILIFMFFILLSCSKKIEIKIEEGNRRVIVENIQIKIDDYSKHLWEVGINKKALVTSNVSVVVEYPSIGKDKITDLTARYPIDSWIIRIKKRSRISGNMFIGYTIAPFTYQDLENNSYFNGDNKISIIFDYDASFPLARRKYPCPSIEHKKFVEEIKVTDTDINKTNSSTSTNSSNNKLEIYPRNSMSIDERDIFRADGNMPVEFPIGKSMQGVITFEFALYSQKERVIYSEFVASEDALEISKESEVPFIDCSFYDPTSERHAPKKFDFLELKNY